MKIMKIFCCLLEKSRRSYKLRLGDFLEVLQEVTAYANQIKDCDESFTEEEKKEIKILSKIII